MPKPVASVLSVQMLLGHRHTDTTLGYARLYNITVANDYYSAMASIEKQLNITTASPNEQLADQPTIRLLQMVNALIGPTPTAVQQSTATQLRTGIIQLATSQIDAEVLAS